MSIFCASIGDEDGDLPDDWTECVGCGDIFLESELESGACPTCWDNRTRRCTWQEEKRRSVAGDETE